MPTVTLAPDQAPPALAPFYHAAVQEQLRALMTMAGGLAHNLRSPLTAIMGRAEIIGVRQVKLRDQMQEIVRECERANGMLQAITLMLRFHANTDPGLVNLNDLVERECEFMRLDRHFKHQINTAFALADELPAVTAVYGALARAFVAVVRNAVIAVSDAPEQRLAIGTESKGGAVSISVRDTGLGIPPEHLPHVFEPGFSTLERAGTSPTAVERYGTHPVEGSGRGYGLAYAAAAVCESGGTIEVTSEPGAGTTVTMSFPVK